ncbi:MAG TPA: hypothetical protein PLP07_15545 [Pyrinomonadaceae bacterium]|nr:hypothetical protein [Chloracidobacterium sp.]MBP9936159.1 hypothetical protein [Pyrinomonadaceae bacterium]HQX57337.1 hypothetical protein [Pyrinomonadaceae bacterium]HQY68320.1 hypothetical protein [Pyrinomonadaceae bacterium]HRA39682.1 hypothetical protein [Pyrinomonadaceae bacterium]
MHYDRLCSGNDRAVAHILDIFGVLPENRVIIRDHNCLSARFFEVLPCLAKIPGSATDAQEGRPGSSGLTEYHDW